MTETSKKADTIKIKSILSSIDRVVFFWVDPAKFKSYLIFWLFLSSLTNIAFLIYLFEHFYKK